MGAAPPRAQRARRGSRWQGASRAPQAPSRRPCVGLSSWGWSPGSRGRGMRCSVDSRAAFRTAGTSKLAFPHDAVFTSLGTTLQTFSAPPDVKPPICPSHAARNVPNGTEALRCCDFPIAAKVAPRRARFVHQRLSRNSLEPKWLRSVCVCVCTCFLLVNGCMQRW